MRLSPRAVGAVTVGLLIAGILSLLAFGLLNKESVTGRSGIARLQKPAPEFTLTLFDGGQLTLSQYQGQPMVINFWASWCPPCRQEAPLLERTWRSYKQDGVLFVGVDMQDTEAEGMAYLQEYDITYPNGLDRDGKISVEYGVIGLPVTFFVNSDGIVERRWVGAIKESRLLTWVDEMVAGIAPSGESEGENPESYFKFE